MITKKLMSLILLLGCTINTTTYGMQKLTLEEHQEEFTRLMVTPGIQELLTAIEAMTLEDQERLVESLKKEYARALGTQNNNDDDAHLATLVQALTISIDREHQEYEGLIKKAPDLYTRCFTELLNDPKIYSFIAAIKALPGTERQRIMQILRSKTVLGFPDLDPEERAKALTAALASLTKKNDGTIRGHYREADIPGIQMVTVFAVILIIIVGSHWIRCYFAGNSQERLTLNCEDFFAENSEEILEKRYHRSTRYYTSAATGPEHSLVLLFLGLLVGVIA